MKNIFNSISSYTMYIFFLLFYLVIYLIAFFLSLLIFPFEIYKDLNFKETMMYNVLNELLD